MKAISFTIASALLSIAGGSIFAQVDPATGNTGSTPSTNQNTNTYQTTPAPAQQNNPFVTRPAGTTQPAGVTQPSGVAAPSTQPSNPFGTSTQPSGTQTHNDYHLTQPTPSPVGAQINSGQTSPEQMPAGQQQTGWTQIQQDQLPGGMTETLKDPQYSGWEQSTIYYNKGTNEYSLDVGSGTEIKNYRFDSNGNPVTQQQQKPVGDQ
jgi:hypothetical protein